MTPSALALASVLALSGPPPTALLQRSPGPHASGPPPDLSLHLHLGGAVAGAAAAPVGDALRWRTAEGLPVCSGDVCQMVVDVPGYALSFGSTRTVRADAFVALLSISHVEPFASVGRALAVTGIRLDYSPSSFEPQGSGARGWGNVLLRVRLRLDADNRVVVPEPPR